MPFCKVNGIRLSKDDPRALYCGDREFIDEDPFFFKDSQIVCETCTGFCECDHPTWQKFIINIECFDEEFDREYIEQILIEHFGEKCGEIEVLAGRVV